jgi:endonuclease/exonuclease/phosphatase family metal-dependent hydrolase
MRLATFNIESLDLPPKAGVEIEARALVLRPLVERLEADVLCLQEVNAQRVAGEKERKLVALDKVLEGTRYAGFNRVCSSGSDGRGPADVHNLVTLSRLPIKESREVRHNLVPPVQLSLQTAEPAHCARAARFERPLLVTEIDIGSGRTLSVINLHFRAPLAASISGQKLAPFVWKSIGGWAEGYFVAATQRAAQALELRLLIDRMLEADPGALVAVAGDFNAEDHETAVKIAVGAEEDTGNGSLAGKSLVVLDRALPADRRWSVLHYGRPQMLDHILASRSLLGSFRGAEVHNETLGDEAIGYAKGLTPLGSYHAGVVADLAV